MPPKLCLVILYHLDGLFPFTGLSQTDQSFSSKVHQTPVALIQGPGENVKLTCNHTIPDYYMILWYQQSAGDTAIKLIGNIYTQSVTMETSFEKHFSVSGNGGKEAYLHIQSLRQPEDSSVYFCAASQHSDMINLLTHDHR
uniref:Ig-like domain-containing protein n=1 Tax=Esox lucius TaxID=8010 RepID=A0AAY5KHL8_ESOLU